MQQFLKFITWCLFLCTAQHVSGILMPETCWAVHTSVRQVINLRNCCIWLVNLFEIHGPCFACSWSKDMTVKRQTTYFCFSDAWGTDPLFSGHENCLCLCCCHQHLGYCTVTEMPHPQSHLMSGHRDPSLWIGSSLPRIYTVLMLQSCNNTLYHM
jgi:hypothetical protein